MDKSVLGLLGGASALALVSGSAAAAGSPVNEGSALKPAQSYAELLDSIPDAVNTLRAEDQKTASGGSEPLQLAQYYYGYPHHHHHHHHHHHNYVYRYFLPHHYSHHHHHHHHHHAVVIPLPQ
jgi:hypothetical protein